MAIRAEELETAIFASLHPYDGSRSASLAEWGNSLAEVFGQRPNDADLVAAMNRLRNRDLISLKKYMSNGSVWYYAETEQVNEHWFFYTESFVVVITDAGRCVWESRSC